MFVINIVALLQAFLLKLTSTTEKIRYFRKLSQSWMKYYYVSFHAFDVLLPNWNPLKCCIFARIAYQTLKHKKKNSCKFHNQKWKGHYIFYVFDVLLLVLPLFYYPRVTERSSMSLKYFSNITSGLFTHNVPNITLRAKKSLDSD